MWHLRLHHLPPPILVSPYPSLFVHMPLALNALLNIYLVILGNSLGSPLDHQVSPLASFSLWAFPKVAQIPLSSPITALITLGCHCLKVVCLPLLD